MNDAELIEFKNRQRRMWASFTPAAVFTVPVAAHLVNFAQVRAGETVLDIGTGTGVVAICAARAGAQVTGLDLTPALLDVARENARISRQSIVWTEGDAEQLPYPDATFDVVLSQFGHIFAPRPDKAIAEMRRVLKPSGRLAFATWPPEHFVGRMFALVAKNSPPPPAGTSPPFEWGIPARIGERLAAGFAEPFYARGEMRVPALSLEHFRAFMEQSVGPIQTLVGALRADPDKLAELRARFEALAAPYFFDNEVHQDYLLARAQAR